MTSTLDLNACCTITYGHPLARLLLGDSLHPGGLPVTSKLGGLMGIDAAQSVLDAGCGLGATAVHLARTAGCHVTGVTLEDDGAAVAYELAGRSGVEDRVRFVQGDVLHVDLAGQQFDSIVMECVLSIIEDKGAALRRLGGFLRPGGRIGLSDVTASGPLPPELEGPLATAGCVGGAVSLGEYRALLEGEGFVIEHLLDLPEVTESFMAGVRGKMLLAAAAVRGRVLAGARRIFALAQELVSQRVLGYGLVVVRKPE